MEKDVRDRADAAASKKNVLLIVPKLDQGGLERVCVRTARIMGEDCRVFIAAFDPSDPAYDLTGLSVYDLHAPAAKGKAGKVLRVFDRAEAEKTEKKACHRRSVQLRPHREPGERGGGRTRGDLVRLKKLCRSGKGKGAGGDRPKEQPPDLLFPGAGKGSRKTLQLFRRGRFV